MELNRSRVEALLAACKNATRGARATREDGDYYQGGTYIGVGQCHYEDGRMVPGASDSKYGTYFDVDICRVESAADEALLLLSDPDTIEALCAAWLEAHE